MASGGYNSGEDSFTDAQSRMAKALILQQHHAGAPWNKT
jgi:hypothetical protein